MQFKMLHSNMALVYLCFIIVLTACAAAPVEFVSDYAGQDQRQIKTLSNDDIRQLRNGEGWGMAKAAELNGMPGPAHLLQMKRQIALTAEQEAQLQVLFDDMKAQAIPLGNELIRLETMLNEGFANRTITPENLDQILRLISETRREIRYVHLATHLVTPGILTTRQIAEYNRLRGYGSQDPCRFVPEGHDKAMWKKHNDCQ